MNSKKILDLKKKIEVGNPGHPTGTLTTTFHKPAGEANTYVQFEYSP